MNVRRILCALTLAGGSVGLLSTAAAAAGPNVAPGCSFDQADGVLSCTTSVTTSSQFGPETTNGLYVPANTLFDGISGAQICSTEFAGLISTAPASIMMTGSTYLIESVTVSTTIQRHGLNGKVFTSSSSTTSSLFQVVTGSMGCGWV